MANTFDLKTKIERAIFALLTTTGVTQAAQTFPGTAANMTIDRPLPCTTIDAGEGLNEDFQPGNYRFVKGKIILQDVATQQPADPNYQSAFVAARKRADAVIGTLVQSDDDTTMDYTRRLLNTVGRQMAIDASGGADPVQKLAASNNCDMADFTLLYWILQDYGDPKLENGGDVSYFERELLFECVACNSNID
jgi:hypothetical protein